MYLANKSISDLEILNKTVFKVKNIYFVQGGLNDAN